jgi:quercetin dioxygenase-like cupin family protein
MTNRQPWLWVMTLLAIVMLAGTALGSTVAQGTPVSGGTPESSGVVREVLSRGMPIAAGGDALELVRYTIPPDTTLPVHTHPGMQVAWIVSGTLHYTVVEGTVPLHRGGDLDTPAEAITPASGEVAIEPGDAFVEQEGVVHFGRNGGPEPVVILVASLLDPAEPPALVATPAA